jgi:hypothetical protein
VLQRIEPRPEVAGKLLKLVSERNSDEIRPIQGDTVIEKKEISNKQNFPV